MENMLLLFSKILEVEKIINISQYNRILLLSDYVVYVVYMSPAEWIRQAEWIKIANIHFFLNTVKKLNVCICNTNIFSLYTLGVILCFHS